MATDNHTTAKKTIVILGDFIHEGIETSIKGLGFQHIKRKLFRVMPQTWLKRIAEIKKLRSSDELAAVIVYLPTPVFLYGCKSGFAEAWKALLSELGDCPAILFAYEDNLQGEFRYFDTNSGQFLTADALEEKIEELCKDEDYDEYEDEYGYGRVKRLRLTAEQIRDSEQSPKEIRNFLRVLYGTEIQVCPFKTRADVTLRIDEFLEELEGGIFLRLYVPTNRWQAEQLASFLRTFERYLRQIERKSFVVDTRQTDNGIIYLFRAEKAIADMQELEEAVNRFDQFMRLCRDNPDEATSLFKSVGIDDMDAGYLISRYTKDYQRLLLDTRHEFEYKSLLLRQRFETGLIENDNTTSLQNIESGSASVALCLTGNTGPISINVSNIVSKGDVSTQNEVSRIINGDITYNEQDQRLLQLFGSYASRLESVQLRSDLDQLKDTSSPDKSKKTSRQRIVSFLYRVGTKLGEHATDLGIKALAAYLESLMRSA
jgi:hypothetical protein